MGLFTKRENTLLKDVKHTLAKQQFPGTSTALLALCDVTSVTCKANTLNIELHMSIACNDHVEQLKQLLSDTLSDLCEFSSVNLVITTQIKQINRSDKLTGVKQVVLVASGKGGVGKSTTSVNLALALASAGAKVGLLDADIFGPSIPMMLNGVGRKPQSQDGKLLEPVELGGIFTMSLGFLVEADDAAVWRGPMASRAVAQLMFETNWGQLDYLVVDMPPGTGDIQLTMTQQAPVSGAIIVTTPQNIALADAQKGIAMFNKVNTPVLGVIENMSYHRCQQCGFEEHIFGQDGGNKMADDNKVALLGHIPLQSQIRASADIGQPSVLSEPNSDTSVIYKNIALNVAIALNNTDLSIPSIVLTQQ